MPKQTERTRYESREQIDPSRTWDLSSIYPDDAAFEQALDQAASLPARFASYEGTISQDPAKLLEYLELNTQANVELGKLANYAQRKSDEDTRQARYQEYTDRVMGVFVQIGAASAWVVPELLGVEPQRLEGFFTSEPRLEAYRRTIDDVLRQREHVLSPAEEALLAKATDMARQPENVYSLLNDADLTFPDAIDAKGASHPVTHGSYVPLLMQPDRALRQSAYESLYDTYGAFRNTSAALLSAQTKQQRFYAEARRYDSTLEAALFGNEVPVEVYGNLIEAVHANLPALHKYLKLRKELLGLEELRFWDLYVPVVEQAEMSFTYDEACAIILQALEPLGPAYLDVVRQALEGRWIDVYETPGKRSGAYSAGGFGMHPFMLLNWQGTLDDVFTLIHEMGHSVHTYLSCKHQPPQDCDYVIFVAEVASTCNEALLTHWLLDHAEDDRQKAYLLNHFLEQFRATLYRQAMFAEFELEANRLTESDQALTADALCQLYARLNQEYYGPEAVVDERIALEWARIPHFYYDYYVYQYATGFAAAIALSERILHGGPQAVLDYLGFLSGGSSKPPIELLRGAGVDMASPQPINDALAEFDRLVDEFAQLMRTLD